VGLGTQQPVRLPLAFASAEAPGRFFHKSIAEMRESDGLAGITSLKSIAGIQNRTFTGQHPSFEA